MSELESCLGANHHQIQRRIVNGGLREIAHKEQNVTIETGTTFTDATKRLCPAHFSLAQTKFFASSVLPVPLYVATCG
jgi:hypothetical protein